MRSSVLTVLVASVAVVTACSGDTEPADPPIPTDALTTNTASPTDTETSRDAVTQTATSSTEPATESPSESTTESPTSEAGGLPTMPEEAKEDTEAGAEAFVRHYIDLINYTGMHPEAGILEPLAEGSCEACNNLAATVEYSKDNGHYLLDPLWIPHDFSTTVFSTDRTALVRVEVEQPSQDVLDGDGSKVDEVESDRFTLVNELIFTDGWRVQQASYQPLE